LSTLAIATAKEVFDLLRDDLAAVEQELGRDSSSGVSTITEIAEYLRGGGGKRIRPTLLLLSAHTLGYSAHRHAGPRRHHRRRRHPPRPPLGEHHLGQ
jgi:octaprenyl-diphosphate synthase